MAAMKIKALRDWLGLPPSAEELERRLAIAKDFGWPPIYRHPTPPPPPKPRRIKILTEPLHQYLVENPGHAVVTVSARDHRQARVKAGKLLDLRLYNYLKITRIKSKPIQLARTRYRAMTDVELAANLAAAKEEFDELILETKLRQK